MLTAAIKAHLTGVYPNTIDDLTEFDPQLHLDIVQMRQAIEWFLYEDKTTLKAKDLNSQLKRG